MCEDDEKKKPGEATKVCFFWLRGRCKFGRRCRFSHSRPTCRYADNCKYGPTQCWYSHSPTPKVSMLGGTSKGKNYFRNLHRRNKQKALKAEVITLKEKVKELDDQLELEKKKNEKLLTELGKKKSRPTRCPPAPPAAQCPPQAPSGQKAELEEPKVKEEGKKFMQGVVKWHEDFLEQLHMWCLCVGDDFVEDILNILVQPYMSEIYDTVWTICWDD